jgi:2-dehydro-3-deoxygluconokinase
LKESVDILSIGEAMVELLPANLTQTPFTHEQESAFATSSAPMFRQSFGGDAFNTAVAAARLGSKVHFLTRFAKDPFGRELHHRMVQEGIQTSGNKTVPGFTGLYWLRGGNADPSERVYYRKGSAASTLSELDISPLYIEQSKIVFSTLVTLSLSQSSRAAVRKAFMLARKNHVPTVLD